jgi:hypothetical protein
MAQAGAEMETGNGPPMAPGTRRRAPGRSDARRPVRERAKALSLAARNRAAPPGAITRMGKLYGSSSDVKVGVGVVAVEGPNGTTQAQGRRVTQAQAEAERLSASG